MLFLRIWGWGLIYIIPIKKKRCRIKKIEEHLAHPTTCKNNDSDKLQDIRIDALFALDFFLSTHRVVHRTRIIWPHRSLHILNYPMNSSKSIHLSHTTLFYDLPKIPIPYFRLLQLLLQPIILIYDNPTNLCTKYPIRKMYIFHPLAKTQIKLILILFNLKK